MTRSRGNANGNSSRNPNEHAKCVIIGAGIHGLSTAWHLASELRAAGRGGGRDILVIDKSGIGAGASGIACGVIRNNYFQPAMRELMAHSVDVWESDPAGFSYHPVGYLQISHEAMREDVASIHEQQRAIGYDSTFIEGARASHAYMRRIFDDWQARGITSVLHEHRGGYANNMASLRGLWAKAAAEGVRLLTGVVHEGFERDASGAVTAVVTDRGSIACERVVVATGPWVQRQWAMLDLPAVTRVRGSDGARHDVPTWSYWALQEGTLDVDPGTLTDNDGRLPPVVHVDTDVPLRDERGLVSEGPWGIYYKPDFHFGGVQGGAMPYQIDKPGSEVAVDPYGPRSPDFVVGEEFYRLWTAALAFCQKRFEGRNHLMKREPSGGIGSFTPDSFPVFDTFADNVYFIADSNHGYKMIGVGALVAKELMGRPQALLEPFRYARFAEGRLHPASHSPFPWS
ncbi:MAG: FAD-binding oxidoreductase [Gemmatimonadales bacterium]|nr:FAD-binding oxidoreductase [Candidatus Palauibacter irciniicola]MYC19050.1 FAD-binding oxidoreductase [Gemmatimonadales bacterium]